MALEMINVNMEHRLEWLEIVNACAIRGIVKIIARKRLAVRMLVEKLA